jgi:hypothetical protein
LSGLKEFVPINIEMMRGKDVVQSYKQAARKMVHQNQWRGKRGQSPTLANRHGEQDTPETKEDVPIHGHRLISIKKNGTF